MDEDDPKLTMEDYPDLDFGGSRLSGTSLLDITHGNEQAALMEWETKPSYRTYPVPEWW